jgi:haloacetate dehalogenase
MADPDAWYGISGDHMDPEAYDDVHRAIHDPETVHTMIEDYRAGLGIDRVHDKAERASGRTIPCPMLYLWAKQDDMEYLYGNPTEIWQRWATDLRGQSLDCRHHMSEERPEELAALLLEFLRGEITPSS